MIPLDVFKDEWGVTEHFRPQNVFICSRFFSCDSLAHCIKRSPDLRFLMLFGSPAMLIIVLCTTNGDVLSHTEFINVHILHALSLPGHPLRVTRKPPMANWWVLLLALPEETSITINIVPCVKCAPETAARW